MAYRWILLSLLIGCAAREMPSPYVQCKIPVPAKWKRPPEGTLQYVKPRKEPKCNPTGTCFVLKSDLDLMNVNLRRSEHARQALVDLFEALTNPYKKNPLSEFPAERIEDPDSPIELDLSKIPEIPPR